MLVNFTEPVVLIETLSTAAAREATNGPDFIHRAEDILGTEIHVLSGREEAGYSARGVISSFQPADGIVGDLGGGSLELIDVKDRSIGDGITLPLGSLRLHDMSKGSTDVAAEIAREQIALFERDRAQSVRITLDGWETRALHKRALDWFWSWFRPQF